MSVGGKDFDEGQRLIEAAGGVTVARAGNALEVLIGHDPRHWRVVRIDDSEEIDSRCGRSRTITLELELVP